MGERVAEPGLLDKKAEELVSAFKSLVVRRTGIFDFIGPASLSSIVPTSWSWRTGKPETLGAGIRHLIEEDGVDLRVCSLSDEYAILRREQSRMLFLGKPSTQEVSKGGRIHHARIAEVIDRPVGWGRILPLLRLEEFNNPPPDQDFVISVAEMAKHVQDEVIEFELS